ncbi:MAG: GNAT family N-acetyltransferase [Anaerolineaceae bacterium]|nr:GNAT family N-acetyltransferase [Anaerolineaceae bacterium]
MRPIQSEIRKLTIDEFPAFVNMDTEAYPGMKINTEEEKKKIVSRLEEQNKDNTINFYGAFRDGQLMGIMRMHDFVMQVYETQMPTGGIGSVAVDIVRKKEKVARDLLVFYLDHYYEIGAPMAALFPFRPDFYRKMGFGYGTKMSRYELNPAQFPTGNKAHVRHLTADDRKALFECYQRVARKTHGLIEKGKNDLDRLFIPPTHRLIGVDLDGQIQGYIVYRFQSKKPDNVIHNDMEIIEIIYENKTAFLELMAFLHSQADQIHDIIFDSQEEDFHHLFFDPRNPTENLFHEVYHESNTQGVGVMYRILNTRRWFAMLRDHNFNQQNIQVKFNITDTFLPQNNGSVIAHFRDGLASVAEDNYDVEVSMDVSDFSSLAMGCVQFESLLLFGRATISDDAYLSQVQKLFLTHKKPICTTAF